MLGLADIQIGRRAIELGAGMPGHEKYDTAYVLSREPDYVIFVLLDARGEPAVQDWHAVQGQFTESYQLAALVRWAPGDGPWVLETDEWSEDLAGAGYMAGVYERRAAAGPAAEEGGGLEPQPGVP